MVKQMLKRKRPSFTESSYGYKSFNQLLEDAAARGLVELQKDELGRLCHLVGQGCRHLGSSQAAQLVLIYTASH